MKLLFVLPLICLGAVVVQAKLNVKFEWKELEFDWPSNAAKQAALASGDYIPKNNLPLGLERWHNKLFLTVPRWNAGVASSLNYVDLRSRDKSPKVIPYPSWNAHKLPTEKCEGGCSLKDKSTIVSPFRINVDACDRLWVMDTGLADINGEGNQVTPNAILIFDLKTDKLIRRYVIPQDQTIADTFFANIIVDSDPYRCSDSYAYVPDFQGYGLVVYSFRKNRSYRVAHDSFHNDVAAMNFTVDGLNFQWTDGIFGMTVGPVLPDGSKNIYYHAFAAFGEYMVNNKVLQNEAHATSSAASNEFKYVGKRGRNGQSSGEVYDKETEVIFYTLPNNDAIGCWNVNKPHSLATQGIVDKNSETLVFPNSLRIDPEGTVWVLSDKMTTYLYGTWNSNSVNYRVLMGKSRDLIKGTACESRPEFGHELGDKFGPDFGHEFGPVFGPNFGHEFGPNFGPGFGQRRNGYF